MKTRRVNPILELNNDVYTYKDRYIELVKYLEKIIETKQERLKEVKNQFLDNLIKLKININKSQLKKQHKNNQKKQLNCNLKIQAGCEISINSSNSIEGDQSVNADRTQSIKMENDAILNLTQKDFRLNQLNQKKIKLGKKVNHKNNGNLIELDQKTKIKFQQINKLSLEIHKLYQEKEAVINQIYDQINNKQTKLKKVLDKVNNTQQGVINASKLSFIWRSITLKNQENSQNHLQVQTNQDKIFIKKEYSKSLKHKNQGRELQRTHSKKKSNSVQQKNQKKVSKTQEDIEKTIIFDTKMDKEFRENYHGTKQQTNMQLVSQQNINKSISYSTTQKTKRIQNIPKLKLTLNNTESFSMSRNLLNTSIAHGQMINQPQQEINTAQKKKVNKTLMKKKKENQCINLISQQSEVNSYASEEKQFKKNNQTQSKNHDSQSKHQISDPPVQNQLRNGMKKNIIKRKKMLKYIEIID